MLKYQMLLWPVMVVSLFAFVPTSWGESPDEDKAGTAMRQSTVMDEMLVTVSRRETALDEAPVKASVISREEIQRSPVSSVDELMKSIPGISYKRTRFSEAGPGREITLRGINEQKRTLVLVDGIPANAGGSVNWSLIPLDMVERIEVVPGPMSALYGSGAMGGVINIITRKPPENGEATVKAGYGSLNTFSGSAQALGRQGNWGLAAGGKYYDSEGYTSVKDPESYHSDTERTETGFYGKLTRYIDETSSLNAAGYYVDEEYNRGIQTDDQQNLKGLAHLTYEKEMDDGIGLSASLYGEFTNLFVELGARPQYTDIDHTEETENNRIGQLLKINLPLSSVHTITTGIDSSYHWMDKDNIYLQSTRRGHSEGKQVQASLFGQDEMRFDLGEDTFIVTVGARGDYSSSFDGEASDTAPGPNPPVDEDYDGTSWLSFNPKLGLVYELGDRTTFRLSGGRSFAAPTLFEMYTVFTRGPLLLSGNPDLDPETAYSGELGIDHWFTDKLQTRAAFYYTRSQDFIGLRYSTPFTAQYDNISRVAVRGVDFDFVYDLNADWSLNGWYKYNLSKVVEDEADSTTEGNRLPFEPEHRAKIGVVCRAIKPINIDLGLRFEGSRYTSLDNVDDDELEEYFTLDLAVSGLLGDGWSWKLAGENLLDKKYDVYAIPTEESEAPGILVNFSLAYTFH